MNNFKKLFLMKEPTQKFYESSCDESLIHYYRFSRLTTVVPFLYRSEFYSKLTFFNLVKQGLFDLVFLAFGLIFNTFSWLT